MRAWTIFVLIFTTLGAPNASATFCETLTGVNKVTKTLGMVTIVSELTLIKSFFQVWNGLPIADLAGCQNNEDPAKEVLGIISNEKAEKAKEYLQSEKNNFVTRMGCTQETLQTCLTNLGSSLEAWQKMDKLYVGLERARSVHFHDYKDIADAVSIYVPFVDYANSELSLLKLMMVAASKIDDNGQKLGETKRLFRRSMLYFLRKGAELYGERTMAEFNAEKGAQMSVKMRKVGDRILRPFLVQTMQQLQISEELRKTLGITGPANIDDPQWWVNIINANDRNDVRIDKNALQRGMPLKIRSGDFVRFQCGFTYSETISFYVGPPGMMKLREKTTTYYVPSDASDKKTWLSCYLSGPSRGERYCVNWSNAHGIMGAPDCRKSPDLTYQIFSLPNGNKKKAITAGEPVGFWFDRRGGNGNRYLWLSDAYGDLVDGWGVTMPCPYTQFDELDLKNCANEIWRLYWPHYSRELKLLRHGDYMEMKGKQTKNLKCFISRVMIGDADITRCERMKGKQ